MVMFAAAEECYDADEGLSIGSLRRFTGSRRGRFKVSVVFGDRCRSLRD